MKGASDAKHGCEMAAELSQGFWANYSVIICFLQKYKIIYNMTINKSYGSRVTAFFRNDCLKPTQANQDESFIINLDQIPFLFSFVGDKHKNKQGDESSMFKR